MSDALTFRDVTKRYGRRGPPALDAMTFHIPRGTITGFVGPNGAGKTTTFSVVSGFLAPDQGEVDILGEGPFRASTFKGRLGVLPQDAELPDRHTPLELLEHLGRLQGIPKAKARIEANRLVELVRLGDRRNASVATLSHGMRRRVAVATALCGTPELVLLDEPLAGLDPSQAYALRDRLAELRGQQTLVISSHNLSEVERLCDWIVMVRDGRCIRQGPTAEMTGATEVSRWLLRGPPPLEALQARMPEVVFITEGHTLLVRSTHDTVDAISIAVMEVLGTQGVALEAMTRGMGLERRFLDDQAG